MPRRTLKRVDHCLGILQGTLIKLSLFKICMQEYSQTNGPPKETVSR